MESDEGFKTLGFVPRALLAYIPITGLTNAGMTLSGEDMYGNKASDLDKSSAIVSIGVYLLTRQKVPLSPSNTEVVKNVGKGNYWGGVTVDGKRSFVEKNNNENN